MKMIVGLGNVGKEYEPTKHNVGFWVVDELAERWGAASDWKRQEQALTLRKRPEDILLVKPETYMNRSGLAVAALARFYKIETADILVIQDDLDMPVGKLRLRSKGSSGGHRGMESIRQQLGSDAFPRLKIGVDHPGRASMVADYVLQPFAKEQQPAVAEAVVRAADAALVWAQAGIAEAMNRFNGWRADGALPDDPK